MLIKTLRFFQPRMMDEIEKKRLVGFLTPILVVAIIASLVYGAMIIIFIGKNYPTLWIPVPVIFTSVLSAWLLRMERPRIATNLFLISTWLTLTISSVILFGGLTSPTISLSILIIISAGLMFGIRSAFAFAGMTILSNLLMYFGGILKIMPVPKTNVTPFQTLFVYIINIVFTIVLVRQALQAINKSKEKEIRRAEELERFIVSMEETITKRTNELQEQKVFFETLFSYIPVAVVVVDQENRILACNKHFETLFNYRQVDVLDKVLDPLVTTEETLAEAESYTNQTRMGEHTYAICKRKRKDGSLVDVEMQGVPILIDGKHDGALALYRDITDRLQAEEALKANEAKFRSLFENSPIALWEEDFSAVKEWFDDLREKGITDFRKYFNKHPESLISAAKRIKILDVNQATISMFNAGCKEEMLTNVSKVLDEASWDVFRNELVALANGNQYFKAEIMQKRCDGETLIGDLRLSIAPGYEDTWKKVYVSIQDITQRINLEQQLKQSLKKMEYLASTDPLTGLLNRRAIIDFARAEFTRMQREGKTLGFALVDMDNLKGINDQFGHIVGDTALISLGETLENNIRIYDKVGRWGGDEFLVVIPTDRVIKVHQIAKRLKSSINDTQLQLPTGEKLTLQACIGVTNTQNGTKDIGTIDELLHFADEALYLAKKMGRNNIVFLDSQEE